MHLGGAAESSGGRWDGEGGEDGPKTQRRALVKDIRSKLAEGAGQLEGPF